MIPKILPFVIGALIAGSMVTSNIPAVEAAGPMSSDAYDQNGESADLAAAAKLIKLGSYASAIPILAKSIASDPRNPDAFNLMGYSQRKIGEKETALGYYLKALDLDPAHIGANEYLGELYLEMKDPASATERLEVLREACTWPCEEYSRLEKAISDFKTGN
jgi:tetratricopeptide (TPR) repeat protein